MFLQYKFLPVAVLPTFMIYVGLLGGASYVNIFYLLLHDNKYPSEDRELCINIVGLSITLGMWTQLISYYEHTDKWFLSIKCKCILCYVVRLTEVLDI